MSAVLFFLPLLSSLRLQSDLKGIEPRWSGLKDVGEAFSSDVVKHESDTVVIFLQGRVSVE